MAGFILRGGRVIDPASGFDAIADVVIDGGRIASVGERAGKSGSLEVIDCTGLVVAPGFVDCHSHLREPGREDEETIASAAEAAVRGGFTTIVAMPNTDPVADKGNVIKFVRDRGEAAGLARVEAAGAITKGLGGDQLAEYGELVAAGAVALTDDGHGVARSDVMRRALEYATLFDVPLMLHAEDPLLSQGGYMHEGAVSLTLGVRAIPSAAEECMVSRDISLAEKAGKLIHVQHVSSAGTVELIRVAKRRGAAVSCEVTPHHLALCDECLAGASGYRPFDTNLKVNPPLRSQADRSALIEALKDGTIDVVATDHAPHAVDEKEAGIEEAPFGALGLQTALGIVLKELVRPGHLSLIDALARLTIRPATLLALPRGTLGAGSPADITIFDPDATWRVTEDAIVSRSKNSPFLGWELPGVVNRVFVGGSPVLVDGEATPAPTMIGAGGGAR